MGKAAGGAAADDIFLNETSRLLRQEDKPSVLVFTRGQTAELGRLLNTTLFRL